MNILEEADMLLEIAERIAKKYNKTVQEVWQEAIVELTLMKKKLIKRGGYDANIIFNGDNFNGDNCNRIYSIRSS